MATPVGKVRAPKHERRLVYHESPLVTVSSAAKTSPQSTSMAKSPHNGVQAEVPKRVTPSPVSQTGNKVSGGIDREQPKRQLFVSAPGHSSLPSSPRTSTKSALERWQPEIHVVSPARRRLFGSSSLEDVAETLRRKSEKDSSKAGNSSKKITHPVSPARSVNAARRTAVKPLFGITSWESITCMNMPQVSPRGSASYVSATAGGGGAKQSTMEPTSSKKAPIPPELVSLLAPRVSMKNKSGKRRKFPQSHQEVLRKAEARRKKFVPPRRQLPRRCKSHTTSTVSLMEESDDDLYFDMIRHKALSTVPDTVSTQRAASSISPMAESEPTDTNESIQNFKNDQREPNVVALPETRGRTPKSKEAAKKPRKIKTSVARKHALPKKIREVELVGPQATIPATRLTRRSHHDAKMAARVDSPSVHDSSSHSDRKEKAANSSPRAVINVTTSTSRSVDRSRSKIHKVRFAPTTTTFSLEIRVKTSARSKRGDREKLASPALSQATVQTIANEITQAYLAQEISAANETGEDQSDEEEYDTSSSSESDQENGEADDDAPHQKQAQHQRLKDAPAPREPEVALDDSHDVRSVASEITMDIELLQGEREIAGKRARVMNLPGAEGGGFPTNDYPPDVGPQMLPQDDDDNDDNEMQHPRKRRRVDSLNDPERSTRILKRPRGRRMVANATGGMLATLTNSGQILQEDKKQPPQQRRRRLFRSTDSLAGCSLASLNSVKSSPERVPKVASFNRVPGEVSVSTSRTESHEQANRKVAAAVPYGHYVAVESSKNTRPSERRCGKCSGCRQTFDCLTCKSCIRNLQEGRRVDQGLGCLRRVCRANHVQPMDTLARTGSVAGDLQPTLEVAYAPHLQAREDDGDFSMSYASDTGSVYSTASKMRRSRAARFWSRRWAEERKNKLASAVAAEQEAAVLDEPRNKLAVQSKKRGRGKRSKSTLHDLELPMPTDGSVASLLASRRSLRALMQYDEADQDWI